MLDAGSIKITSRDGSLFLTTSGIYTTAVNGNGGSITVDAGLISLDSSQITSVSNFGVGGNININADALVMNTGYILAYAPTSLVGGNISIDVPSLIASGNTPIRRPSQYPIPAQRFRAERDPGHRHGPNFFPGA